MQNIFDSIQLNRPKFNKFDLSHERKQTIAMGDLVPILCKEMFPGETWKGNHEVFLRFNPLLYPVMHRVNVFTNTFIVPYRLLWDEFPDFISGGEDGLQAPVFPKIQLGSDDEMLTIPGTLADYLGLPHISPVVSEFFPVSALPFRAYQLIWNEYFRDQNLQPKIPISKASGDVAPGDLIELMTIRKRAWEKDYFTSALPWEQRGNPVITPLEGAGTVTYKAQSTVHKSVDGTPVTTTSTLGTIGVGDGGLNSTVAGPTNTTARIENIDEVALTSAGFSINDLRVAVRLQEWYERAARGGSRLIEIIQSMFGKKSSDARLQRPEYIGGSKKPVIISEVLQTSSTDGVSPQGNMAGHAYSAGGNSSFKYTAEEHCFVITLMSILPTTAYQQGVPKEWQKFDKFDLLWPTFGNLGEQPVMQNELYIHPTDANAYNDEVFGYQSRYAEYKYQSSTVHGLLKNEMSYVHMGRIFSAKPELNGDFISADPTTRIFPTTDEQQQIVCQIYNKISALRPLPYHNVPTL